jgi:glucosamine-6-phosphate deaminase
MEVIIRPTADTAAGLVAALVAKSLRQTPRLVLGFATGRTMERVYALLAREHRERGLSFKQVSTFNLDEYVGLPSGSHDSYRHYMHDKFFRHIDIAPERTFLPDGNAKDLDAECAAYEHRITQAGGIDLQLLGIGAVGHVGFNEPLSALFSRTRVKALSPQTVAQNAVMFGGDAKKVPRRAITMGVGTILDCRRCMLLATGDDKAEIIAKAVEGPVTSMISASALQLHARCTVVVDEAAASCLTQQEYYRWVFDNEPEWKEFR